MATVWTVNIGDPGDRIDYLIDLNDVSASVGILRAVMGPDGIGDACDTSDSDGDGFLVVLENPGPAARGTPQPHAAILTPNPQADIPAVSAWGLIVMTLLVLTAGAVLLGRKPRIQT
ncbi:MAG: IPTL-CTERM sorting domain-containing protein [Planctomycetes bacterium]|nr:IPTL-CTERM sorting domain-containing protein [Planctomycetota bacterium]